ncbi:serine/threonine protein phosphatase 1 [Rhodoligotrophos appendicifer]|uniref:metallophosphoesterase family protein n=1 Tax=Rhodoligotrophos appendicifer TaxID=987056 RepID=UPI001187235C|nr:metallophosphoesterase family protein [Rhodoligotrophos appendicifer]
MISTLDTGFWNGLLGRSKKKSVEILPEGLRIYAVGDIHGCYHLLEDLWLRMRADAEARPAPELVEIYLGDYVDRGPSSNGVIESLCKPAPEGWERVCLRGNHEELMLGFIENPASLELWRSAGALETLASYAVDVTRSRDPAQAEAIAADFSSKLPPHHLEFLRDLPVYVSIGQYFFVHAGVKPGVPLDRQRQQEMLWIRDAFLQSEADFGKIIVHGHTPVEQPEYRKNRINVDTGAYLTGRLTCVVLEGDSVRFL